MIKAIVGSNQYRETDKIRVTIWNEYVSEKTKAEVAAVYPHGIHHALAEGLAPYGFLIRTAKDEIVERVYQRVLEGMGLIVLHSGHFSKLFRFSAWS
ncbi:hypothetical protein PSTEL_08105 [Paenibacillus stellifer]|uniref:ThuA-like domain-containing protein n=1 Tax=Paenibacillus stellifer TaxID=169760 RepID=A0A089LSI9_9BACL|nr:hypothetical protein PSTEL_08105 [Paenibacillus stellifer]